VTHRQLLWLAAFWQFVYMVDFLLPLPLGPLLSQDLGFAAPDVAWLTVSYTVASLIAGLLVSAFLVRRFARAQLVLGGLTGFALANAATVWVDQLSGLLIFRALAALTGAPVIATLMAEVIDTTPVDRRGHAVAKVMSGASLAVILGVPFALGVANWGGWRVAFALIASATAVLVAVLWHLGLGHRAVLKQDDSALGWDVQIGQSHWTHMLQLGSVRQALLLQMLSQFATFLIIPVLATFLVSNLHIPAELIPLVYAAGGVVSFACMRLSGLAADRHGYRAPLLLACAVLMLSMLMLAGSPLLLAERPLLAMATFVAFMASNAAKNVALASHTAGAPPANMRGSFMNIQSSMQDAAILLAAMGPLLLLSQPSPDAPMVGMPTLVIVALIALLILTAVDAMNVFKVTQR
jgi:predicted MFS family arabinose efflux permease